MFLSIIKYIEVIILGIVQGLAEFLPISSSAHLIICRDVFGLCNNFNQNTALVFDVSLHFGTAIAIIVFFFSEFLNILRKSLKKEKEIKERKLLFGIILACIPAAIVGILFEDIIAGIIRDNLIIVAIALIVMGIIIYYADKKSKSQVDLYEISLLDSFIIGTSQVLALIPGFSRSGTTIACARILKIDKESACKFSFFLSLPVVLGATLLVFIKPGNLELVINQIDIFLIGTICSFLFGMICIKYLLKFIKNNDFKVFMIYRIILGIIVLLSVIL